ncbi:MAG TPA: hypothetical protein VF221_15630 [Chloroflexota bacterium]
MGKSRGRWPTLRSWVVAGIVGIALAYLLDDERGARWRLLARQVSGVLRRTEPLRSAQGARGRDGRADQRREETIFMSQPDNPNPDDNTLRDRIESVVFGPDAPQGEYNLNVADGIAELHGQLDTEEDIDTLIAMVASVRDVVAVESYLHLPGEVAPDKASAIRASDAS